MKSKISLLCVAVLLLGAVAPLSLLCTSAYAETQVQESEYIPHFGQGEGGEQVGIGSNTNLVAEPPLTFALPPQKFPDGETTAPPNPTPEDDDGSTELPGVGLVPPGSGNSGDGDGSTELPGVGLVPPGSGNSGDGDGSTELPGVGLVPPGSGNSEDGDGSTELPGAGLVPPGSGNSGDGGGSTELPGVGLVPPGPPEGENNGDGSDKPKEPEGGERPLTGTVSNFYELCAAVEHGIQNITFLSDITIPAQEHVELGGERGEVKLIDTAGFSLIVEGVLFVNQDVVIHGLGVDKPVLDIKAGGYLTRLATKFSAASVIRATGENGTAIHFSENSAYDSPTTAFLKVEAEHGTAVFCEQELTFTFTFITAKTGVVSTQKVNFLMSAVNASLQAVKAPYISADTTKFYPQDESYGSIPYRRLGEFLEENCIIYTGDEIPSYFHEPLIMPILLKAPGVPDLEMRMLLNIDASLVNINVQGAYKAPFMEEEWMELCGFNYKQSVVFTFIIDDLKIPIISDKKVFFGALHITYMYSGEEDNLILWCSQDEGKTWYMDKVKDSWFYNPASNMIQMIMEPKADMLWIYWESSAGESKIFTMSKDMIGEEIEDLPGGDRNGGDREVSTGLGESWREEPAVTENGQRDSSVAENQLEASLPPNNTQDTPPQQAGQGAEAVYAPANTYADLPEYSTNEFGITLSSKRLLALMNANPNYVTFMHNGLRVSVPTEFLRLIDVENSTKITFTMYSPTANEYKIAIMLDDTFVEYNLEKPIHFRIYNTAAENISLLFNGQKTQGSYSQASETADFEIYSFGSYRVDAVKGEENTANSEILDKQVVGELPQNTTNYTKIIVGAGALGALAFAGYIQIKKREK